MLPVYPWNRDHSAPAAPAAPTAYTPTSDATANTSSTTGTPGFPRTSTTALGALTFSTPDDTTFQVAIAGSLVVENRQILKYEILEALEAGRRRVIVECAHCVYMDSSGLGALVSANKAVRRAGGVLTVRHLTADLETLFALTRVDTVLTVEAAPAGER